MSILDNSHCLLHVYEKFDTRSVCGESTARIVRPDVSRIDGRCVYGRRTLWIR